MTADLEKILKRMVSNKKTPSERMEISSEIGSILGDLFKDGSYTMEVSSVDGDGIGIGIDAHLNGHEIEMRCLCWREKV